MSERSEPSLGYVQITVGKLDALESTLVRPHGTAPMTPSCGVALLVVRVLKCPWSEDYMWRGILAR